MYFSCNHFDKTSNCACNCTVDIMGRFPGSAKKNLGREVMRRVNEKTLDLSNELTK